MCGLAGFIGFENGKELAERANVIQQHRGPDYQGTWVDEKVAFAHQRLSILDLSALGNQPMQKDGLIIIFNGEIYNYKELRKSLENQGVSFTSTSDTETLLELYRSKGKECVKDLIGMFAFAIYDQTKSEILIARDHFGIKPLFYKASGGKLCFSSELKTLMDLGISDKQLNMQSLVGAMNYLWVPGNESMVEDVQKLPPAHIAVFDINTGQLKQEEYWTLSTEVDDSIGEAEVREELERTMERHLVADVSISSFLSGGLDSSLISVIAKQKLGSLTTYTIGTEEKDKKVEQMPEDEKYARKLSKQFGFEHHEIVITPDILSHLPKIVEVLDEPIGDPAAINTYLICESARKNGSKVVLSGMGADEIFCGYRRQKALMLAEKYHRVPGPLRSVASMGIQALPVKAMGRGIKATRWAKRFDSFASLPIPDAYMRSYSYYDGKGINALFQKDIDQEYSKLTSQHRERFESHYQGDLKNQMCYTDIQMFMLGLNLTYSDRASMAASVEVRVPFIDRDFISLAMKVAGSKKLQKGESKYILKKVAENYLPHEIIYRPKAGFGAPIRSWIAGDLREMVDDLLSPTALKNRGVINPDTAWKMIKEDRAGKVDYAYQIYQMLTLELWFQRYFDK